jgi:hypothetical protein
VEKIAIVVDNGEQVELVEPRKALEEAGLNPEGFREASINEKLGKHQMKQVRTRESWPARVLSERYSELHRLIESAFKARGPAHSWILESSHDLSKYDGR